ncbi:MAG TPA: DUF4405 domain-containing protein [Longilinea sp.]|nr:DUF4405 domain-containing protein [Longilinea sp.]
MTIQTQPISKTTRNNWWLDLTLAISGFLTIASGIYFFLVPGGYQGGRNPYYGMVIVFDRTTWDVIHTWAGAVMVLACILHIALHYRWFLNTIRNLFRRSPEPKPKRSFRFYVFLVINILIAVGFITGGLSGLYYLAFPGEGAALPTFFFTADVWDFLHTYGGLLMIGAALVHFILHWRWIVKTAGRLMSRTAAPAPQIEMTLSKIEE